LQAEFLGLPDIRPNALAAAGSRVDANVASTAAIVRGGTSRG